MADLNPSTVTPDGKEYREYLIANGYLKPARPGTEITPIRSCVHSTRVYRLDDVGKRLAAERVALGLAGRKDRGFDRDYVCNL